MEASNIKAMREALLKVKKLFDGRIMFQKAVREAHEVVNAALDEPPRNCDVGTPEDQHNRFMRFCDSKSMGYCWGRGCRKCMAQWGQIPYEGENKEIKKCKQ